MSSGAKLTSGKIHPHLHEYFRVFHFSHKTTQGINMMEILFLLQHVCVICWRAEIPTVSTWPFIIYSWQLDTRNFINSYRHFPVHLPAVLPFEDIPKGVKMSPPTEATALENNKHCRNTQWLLARLRALLSQGKHSSPAATCQELSCCKS